MKIKHLFLFVVLLASTARAAETPPAEKGPSLEEQLQGLSTPGNEVPAGIVPEQLYAVQTRYSPLRFRHELAVGGSNNFSGDSFLRSNGVDAAYRFYLSNRWYVGLSGNYVFNSLTSGGMDYANKYLNVADVPYTKYRADLLIGFNLFYGKLRLTMNQVFYFDQYIALGPGLVGYQNSRYGAAVLDAGIAFMMGKHISFRAGFKDYFGYEQRILNSGMAHNILGYLQAGYVFGG